MSELGVPAPVGRIALRATGGLLALLLVINAVAIWEMLAARRGARLQAERELELATTAQGRALEAQLANLRGDFLFLAESPALAALRPNLASENPMVRRWGRLDAEGTLLLFLQGHPAVDGLVLRDPAGAALLVVGRREGAPLVLPPGSEPPVVGVDDLVRTEWPLATTARLEAWIAPARLLAHVEPAAASLRLLAAPPATAATGEELVTVVPVADLRWSPPIRWWLEGRQAGSQLERSVAALAGRFRTTVLLNLAVMAATLVVGLMAVRQARQRALAEAGAAHERQVRELERRLLHSERLASVGRLAAGIAHEVNNPLEGMANFLSLLEAELAAARPEAARRHAARVREGLDRAAGIVRQVLALSDPARTPKETLDLRAPVREAADFLRRQFHGMEIALEEPGEPLPTVGNPVTLGQLFFNLLLNSCQVQDGRGRVEVRLRPEGGRVVVVVADRGPGLDPETLPHLFEPFFSTRGSTGLGLALCHGIVRDHGGEIAGRNRAGGGAEFEVRLPLAPAAPVAAPRRAGGRAS